jgi:CRISPR type IV-associated protein Csf1
MATKATKPAEVMYLSDFFEPQEYGDIEGSCIVCGRITDEGLEIDYSSNFTKWNLLEAGNCICPNCYELTRNQDYRRSMWISTKEGITKFKKDDMLGYILNPPEPPFGMYLTRTWQKQGFFKLINKVNYSRHHYFTALDMQVIRVDLDEAKKMAELGETLRDEGITKEELETGEFRPHRYKDISLQLIEQVKEFANQKLWRLIVYAID